MNKVKHYRKKQGLTIEQLATLSELSISTISDLERYNKIPSQYTMVKLSCALGVPTHHVFNLHYEVLEAFNFRFSEIN